ncbi:fungal-specific transcription factor domain-containing protein, partial [Dipodascopsis tothii]|uniref:fungal-specific transcription factor domain-containing protein n=1 Tax=Dipodascopsis tothii TaxID=44089 RepID=UPI0034CDD26D
EPKRARPAPTLAARLDQFQEAQGYLPPDDVLDALVDLHFLYVHPWVPVLHEASFRQKLRSPAARRAQDVVLHAIVVANVRFCADGRVRDPALQAKLCQACRQYVIATSMESYSVENLQALLIVAFDLIGRGSGPKSWAVVDSMTRTVEHLQLSVEDELDETASPQKFMRRMRFLRKAESWTEAEERRRVFWTVFLLDRFCSVSTGWNPSLTSMDVRRRLPCSGECWAAGRPVVTRFFGIRDFDTSLDAVSTSPSGPPARPADDGEVTALGGFSYCVEATESLSQVTRFFLQQDVNPSSAGQLHEWMLRFKSLDLQLTRWKFDLPAEWRDVRLRPDSRYSRFMDQNLTLAHITHNTSVILLHQFVAYPIAQWQVSSMKLSQVNSAETCVAAAKEIVGMTERYLANMEGPVSPQFAFCLFVTGRALLSHASFSRAELLPEFEGVVAALAEIARRWQGYAVAADEPRGPRENLAAKFQLVLHNTRAQMALNRGDRVDIRQPAYSLEAERGLARTAATTPAEVPWLPEPDSISPPLPLTFQPDFSALYQPRERGAAASPGLDHADIAGWFEDPQFLELDRVWTFGQE